MSTKCTIAYGGEKHDFHLYNECFEDDCVYLEIKGHAMRIPIIVWETIRSFQGVSFELADKTPAEIRKDVEEFVNERIGKVKEARKIKDKKDRDSKIAWAGFLGGLPFGPATDPRDKQVKSGLKTYMQRRRFQQRVRAAVEKLKGEQTKGPYVIDLKTGETKSLGESE